jgi:ribose transport system substrate-binding protein
MKKLFAILMAVTMFAGCAPANPPAADTPATDTPAVEQPVDEPVADAPETDDGSMYISVVSKGFQHQFWQAVKAGADKASADLSVESYFVGPESESDIAAQVDMINSELAKDPDAIALAALDTDSVLSQLSEAQTRGIPVIGFDSGVPDAPAGQIAATASTNNDAAAALGAEKMFEALEDKIAAATADAPVAITILSQDVTSASIQGRTRGFAQKMAELAAGVNSNGVAIEGGYADINTGDSATAAVKIIVVVSASTSATDVANSANGMLNTPNLIGVFCSNEGTVTGFLAALNAGSQVPEGVQVVGFDAGAAQKSAVRQGIFMGSVTQDPFQIGYQAVALAVAAAKGETVADTDTGAQWYDASNIDNPDIALLVYD